MACSRVNFTLLLYINNVGTTTPISGGLSIDYLNSIPHTKPLPAKISNRYPTCGPLGCIMWPRATFVIMWLAAKFVIMYTL